MIYYSSKQRKDTPVIVDAILQRYFKGNEYGANIFVDNGRVENIEICKVSSDNMWTHHANICLYDDDIWEVNTQFNGEKENEMWVYKYFTRLGDACRFVLNGKFKGMKPINVY